MLPSGWDSLMFFYFGLWSNSVRDLENSVFNVSDDAKRGASVIYGTTALFHALKQCDNKRLPMPSALAPEFSGVIGLLLAAPAISLQTFASKSW